MKKIISLFTICLLLLASTFAAGSKNPVDKFLDEYEEVVVAYEKLVKSNDMMKLLELSQKQLEMAESLEEIQEDEDWSVKQTKRLLELETRLAKAVEKLNGTSSPSTTSTDDALDALNALGSLNFGF